MAEKYRGMRKGTQTGGWSRRTGPSVGVGWGRCPAGGKAEGELLAQMTSHWLSNGVYTFSRPSGRLADQSAFGVFTRSSSYLENNSRSERGSRSSHPSRHLLGGSRAGCSYSGSRESSSADCLCPQTLMIRSCGVAPSQPGCPEDHHYQGP